LELLLATPWPDDARTSSASSTASSMGSSAPGSAAGGSSSSSCALLVFLRFLLQKNMYALRDVPPPGLSEPTVLMSAFFGLLQLLQPALQAACEGNTGPLASFPAAELFAGVGPAAEAEPVFNMPRLGGVVTHLAREHPVSALEKQPVAVQPGQADRKQADGSSAYGGSSFLQVG
jgi:Kip1 ubiquitination-promoting complex protein 1